MMAEILGRADGYCRGKGGSMHITDISRRMLGADGIVGGGIPIAVGAARDLRLKPSSSVVFCFFGEAPPTREHSTKLSTWPRSIVSPYCLSAKTTYGRSVPLPKKRPPGAVSPNRATAYGMPGYKVDGNDVEAVFQTVSASVARATGGAGPCSLNV